MPPVDSATPRTLLGAGRSWRRRRLAALGVGEGLVGSPAQGTEASSSPLMCLRPAPLSGGVGLVAQPGASDSTS